MSEVETVTYITHNNVSDMMMFQTEIISPGKSNFPLSKSVCGQLPEGMSIHVQCNVCGGLETQWLSPGHVHDHPMLIVILAESDAH